MSMLSVTLKTPTKTLYKGEADSVRLSTDLGRLELLPDHATLVGTILFSKAYVKHGSVEEKFVIRQGSVLVDKDNNCSILAIEADKESEISIDSMKSYLTYLDEQLQADGRYNDYQMKFLREQHASIEGSLNGDQE